MSIEPVIIQPPGVRDSAHIRVGKVYRRGNRKYKRGILATCDSDGDCADSNNEIYSTEIMRVLMKWLHSIGYDDKQQHKKCPSAPLSSDFENSEMSEFFPVNQPC